MGKRKSRMSLLMKKKPRVENLDKYFTCPFCNHSKSVACTFYKKKNVGVALCSICFERYSAYITPLTEPIDIYSEWIDACEEVNTHYRNSKKNPQSSDVKIEYDVKVECF